MNAFLMCLFALAVAVSAVSSAGMECGIAGTCPNIVSDSSKTFCCKTETVTIPYCCDAGDYAKFAFREAKEAVAAGVGNAVAAVAAAESTKVATATTVGVILLARLM
ncbi:hypothetical protein BV898_09029 [Hypsibius exemplaris]|uniref:Uncharacterized protein n=1 Tax=Hypsibius exemplaris TaxID=2072580 RepID=A0A1W0WNX7_HYPEX|nr:hypothetical protein BV898_09029 [Hypsibius exemplaris]